MGFNSAFKGLKLLKTFGNGRLNNLNDPDRPQCVKMVNLLNLLARLLMLVNVKTKYLAKEKE